MTHVEMEQFIAEYGADIYSFCCCLTGNRQEADDLYQETFLRAVEKQKHLDMAGNPKSYLLSTAVYLWKNHRRKAGWRKRIANTEYSGREDAEIGPKDSCDDLPEQKVIREEMQKTVRDAVLRLPRGVAALLQPYLQPVCADRQQRGSLAEVREVRP